MRKDPMQDKMADHADQVIKMPAKACQYCGRPLSDYGCRPVPMGFWCLMVGLKQDPRTIIGPAPDPLKQIVEETREVKRAAETYERKVAEADKATSAWEQAALAHYRAKQRRYESSRTVLVDGLPAEWAPPGTPTAGELRQLEAIGDEGNTLRQHAAEQVVKARMALDAARARARRQLSRVAV